MNEILAEIDAKVAANRARLRVAAVGRSDETPDDGDRVSTFPNRRQDGAARHIRDDFRKERFIGEMRVVLFEKFAVERSPDQSDRLEALAFESRKNFSHNPALYRVRLEHDERLFYRFHSVLSYEVDVQLN